MTVSRSVNRSTGQPFDRPLDLGPYLGPTVVNFCAVDTHPRLRRHRPISRLSAPQGADRRLGKSCPLGRTFRAHRLARALPPPRGMKDVQGDLRPPQLASGWWELGKERVSRKMEVFRATFVRSERRPVLQVIPARTLRPLELSGRSSSPAARTLRLLELYGCPNSPAARTLWLLELSGCSNSMAARTLWLLELYGCPNSPTAQ